MRGAALIPGQVTVEEVSAERTAETWPVISQLRPHLSEAGYLAMVERMRGNEGYRLAAARVDNDVCAVAGFRVMEMLYCGHILSVDDLVTDEATRSSGLGTALLDWLTEEARRLGCGQIHLDSGVQRLDAHRFYEREGFLKTAWHFASQVTDAGRRARSP